MGPLRDAASANEYANKVTESKFLKITQIKWGYKIIIYEQELCIAHPQNTSSL